MFNYYSTDFRLDSSNRKSWLLTTLRAVLGTSIFGLKIFAANLAIFDGAVIFEQLLLNSAD